MGSYRRDAYLVIHPGAASLAPVAWNVGSQDTAEAASHARVGVLALQGDFLEHELSLRRLGIGFAEVRLPRHLDDVDALIIPGGESTTMARLLDLHQLRTPLQRRVREGMPVWGTCAGMILLARALTEARPEPLGLMDITVDRNAYGRQLQSFQTELAAPALGAAPIPAVFIRAPAIVETGADVEVLARLADGTPAAVRQDHVLATSFHPELTTDVRFHRYFLNMAAQALQPTGGL